MTTIDFYSNVSDKLALAVRLSQKALSRHHNVTLLAGQAETAQTLSKLLWEASPTAFLPNVAAGAPHASRTPIVIHCEANNYVQDDIVINLDPVQPAGFSRFKRLIEIVANDEADKAKARERYAFYRERGYEIKHVDMLKESL